MMKWRRVTHVAIFASLAGNPLHAEIGALVNRYVSYPAVTDIASGISWPSGQALPVFATPASAMDAIEVQALSPDEQLTFSALQGQVNKKKPQILLQDARPNEGRDTWANTPTVDLKIGKSYDSENKYDLLKKYASEVDGVVLYDPAFSSHYRNLAGTIAGIRHALPMTVEVNTRLKEHGVDLKVLEDLTSLKFITPVQIYGYLYDHYWKDCEKRLIVSARPEERGDLHHTRDIAAAVGAAVVWLDCRNSEQRDMMRKFFGDMKVGEAIALGWYTSERSGITTASEFGVGTLPADFYVSPSVFSGTNHHILIPPVPKSPTLENKVYVALFISDGDNIQYNQHAMRVVWDKTNDIRGKMALNWTIAPGLVDIGPGIMNYYYTHATPDDCFVTGPSGMGYMMPTNTLKEPGAPVGEYTRDPSRMDGYTRLTETYLQRSGLRVTTIWDDASSMQRQSYEKNCRHLYGATVQNFKDVPSVAGGVVNDRLRFDKLVVPYAGSFAHISGSMKEEIRKWDGKSPKFLSYQANIWGELKPDRLIELKDKLDEEFPGMIQFVRADHYFNLHNQADGLPFNLALSPETVVRSGDSSADLSSVTDGTPVTLWTAEKKGGRWLGFDFGSTSSLHRMVIRHAGDHGMAPKFNTRQFTIVASEDGKKWKVVNVIRGNHENVTDIDLPSVKARYVKITVEDAGADSTARIADVEIFGSR